MLEPTGFVRRVDILGRLVLPKELRDHCKIADGDGVEIWVHGDQVMLAKHLETCVFCGSRDGLSVFRAKSVCAPCRLKSPASS